MLVPAESKHPSVQKGTQVAAQRPSRYHSESSEFADDDVSILTRRWQRKVWGCKSLAPSIVCQIWAAPGASWAKKGGGVARHFGIDKSGQPPGHPGPRKGGRCKALRDRPRFYSNK